MSDMEFAASKALTMGSNWSCRSSIAATAISPAAPAT